MRRFWAILGIPVLSAGMLLAGSSSFSTTAKAANTLNTPSDRVTFSGKMVVSGGSFTLTSTYCSVQELTVVDTAPVTKCTLAAGGTLDASGTMVGPVAVTGPAGSITFKQTSIKVTGNRHCVTGTGYESDPGPRLVPIRVEGQTFTQSTESPNTFFVCGTFEVYEAGGLPAGISCGPN